jgi:hypothetical protein
VDPVSLIVTALAASAMAGAQNTATAAVKAYTGLKALLRHRFAIDRPPVTPWSSPLTSRNRCMPN